MKFVELVVCSTLNGAWIIDAELKSWCHCGRPFNSHLKRELPLKPLMCEQPPVMTASNTICILHWWVRPHCDHQRSPQGACEKCVYPMNVWSVCVCVRRQQQAEGQGAVVWHWFVKGDNTAHWPAPAPLSVAHTSPAQPSPVASLLFKHEQQIATGAGRGGRRDTGCFDNESPESKEREMRLGEKRKYNKYFSGVVQRQQDLLVFFIHEASSLLTLLKTPWPDDRLTFI